MKRTAFLLVFLISAAIAFSQQLYEPETLRRLGLDAAQIEQIMEVTQESATSASRLQAELNIKKAELARLLLNDEPNQRQIERNLRESADIEVQLRMLEIRRELAIRDVIGTERWTRILRTVRTRERSFEPEQARELVERIGRIQRAFRERQEDIARRLRETGNAALAADVLQQLREIELQYREIADALRQR